MEEKLKRYIEYIEQLGADARYENNMECYDKLMVTLQSIEQWTKKAKKQVEKLKKGDE